VFGPPIFKNFTRSVFRILKQHLMLFNGSFTAGLLDLQKTLVSGQCF